MQVLSVAGGYVTHNVVFADPAVIAAFDRPTHISADQARRPR
jgi:RNA polymerase sigma-70 factor (ECF subfamily)